MTNDTSLNSLDNAYWLHQIECHKPVLECLAAEVGAAGNVLLEETNPHVAHLMLSLLGPMQATLGGRPVVGFESAKVRALLAYLALEADGPHSRDELAGLLWPEERDQTARTNLRNALGNLRQAIADRSAQPPVLFITRETVQFNVESDHSLDVSRFVDLLATCRQHAHRHIETCRSCAQRLQEAVALYRGDLLSRIFLNDSPVFEEWVLVRREELHHQMLDGLYQLASFYERRGDYEQARRYAARQLELDPWREEAHRQAMRTLALSSQRSAALAQYEKCRRILEEELGVEPSQETTALCEQIRAGQLKSHAAKHHLPVWATPFIGREKELAELGALLENPACKLVTIVGPGGIGKTRLALATAAEQTYAFDDGAAFVSLAALNSAEFIAPTIMAALDLPLSRQCEPKEQLLACLREKELLLVLDNIEHILKGSELLSEIIRRAPGVTLLVTSRERLRLQAEWLFDLTELRYPSSESVDASTIEEYSAVQLFVACARRTQRQFVLEDSEVDAVARICRSVQGMPLAIELAATAVQRRSCAAVAAEIESNLRALASEWRDAPERHRSVWAAFEHSWQLLNEDERRVFRQLSVFRGGFQGEAAAQVAGASPSSLSALVEKSLIHVDTRGRYGMQEVVQQYATDKLQQAGEAEQTRRRHQHFFCWLADAAESRLQGAEQIEWLDRLETEQNNIRAALDWSVANDTEAGLRLAGALFLFWFLRAFLSEGRQWLEKLAARTRSDSSFNLVIKAKTLPRAGFLALQQGDFETVTAFAEEARVLCQKAGDKNGFALALALTGAVARAQGQFARAALLYEESLTRFQEEENKWGIAFVLDLLTSIAVIRDDYKQAMVWAGESLTIREELGDKFGIAHSLVNLGDIAGTQGNYEKATTLIEAGLAQLRLLGFKTETVYALQMLGNVAREQADYERAAALYEDSLALSRELNDRQGISFSLYGLGIIKWRQRDYHWARALLEESLALQGKIADKHTVAFVWHALGDVALSQGDYVHATTLFMDSLAAFWELKEDKSGICKALQGLATLATVLAQPERGARLLGAAKAIRDATGIPLPPFDCADYERTVAAVRTQLDEWSFMTAWDEGQAMALERVVEYALTDIA